MPHDEPTPNSSGESEWVATTQTPVLVTAPDGAVTRVLGAVLLSRPGADLLITYDRGSTKVVASDRWSTITYEDPAHPAAPQRVLGAFPVVGGPRNGAWEPQWGLYLYYRGDDAQALLDEPTDPPGDVIHTYRLGPSPDSEQQQYTWITTSTAAPRP